MFVSSAAYMYARLQICTKSYFPAAPLPQREQQNDANNARRFQQYAYTFALMVICTRENI